MARTKHSTVLVSVDILGVKDIISVRAIMATSSKDIDARVV